MKLQYEVLTLGLQTTIQWMPEIQLQEGEGDEEARQYFEDKVPEHMRNKYYNRGHFYRFSTYFVDKKENLIDIMKQLGSESQERIKEELFLLLSFFILTFEYRKHRIRNMIVKNKRNFIGLIEDFKGKCENEDCFSILQVLHQKLQGLPDEIV